MKTRPCYLCSSLNFEKVTEELRKDKKIPVLRCNDCGLIFLDTSHENFVMEEYKNKDYLERNKQLYGQGDIAEYDRMRMATYSKTAGKIIPKLKNDADILEVGCGCGSFLSFIYKEVRNAVGIEINIPLADYARDKLNIPVYTEPVEDIQLDRKFDAIFLLQIIDHLSDPVGVLNKLKGLLKEDGFIYIECPNTDEALMRYLPQESLTKHRRFHYHLAHLWYFNRDVFEKMISKSGLSYKIENVHDWTFLNFMNWWFLGTPSSSIEEAQLDVRLYKDADNTNEYMKDMNELFENIDSEFKEILAKHCLGSTFLCEARLK